MLSIDSKLKKEGAESVEGAAPLLRGSTNWRVSGPLGEGNREGADCHHTPDDLVQGQGVGGLLSGIYWWWWGYCVRVKIIVGYLLVVVGLLCKGGHYCRVFYWWWGGYCVRVEIIVGYFIGGGRLLCKGGNYRRVFYWWWGAIV